MSNRPVRPLVLMSVKGVSKSMPGSMVPLTVRKLMMVSMKRICWEVKVALFRKLANAALAAVISRPMIERTNLPNG